MLSPQRRPNNNTLIRDVLAREILFTVRSPRYAIRVEIDRGTCKSNKQLERFIKDTREEGAGGERSRDRSRLSGRAFATRACLRGGRASRCARQNRASTRNTTRGGSLDLVSQRRRRRLFRVVRGARGRSLRLSRTIERSALGAAQREESPGGQLLLFRPSAK